ncbi:MAG: xanthine dehydrogenase family protein subunit M [Actinophytocola sp.]|uniref:FAD binding domain-containing protein n=1 Tax=Actinophytocola sp. TaxID=1872138 RepID=UPI0013207D13|nr:xanthine dehydrogenase family protein subunit M [Actinophytocola sp.]MPZ82460.1 xanthine dehydrogenase family protein subunit M [Actinophytocola sp.]
MQVPASFQYRKATSVEHALALLAEYGPESAVVAGGHSLLPMMKLRLAHPEALIDINDLGELAGIRVEDGELVIGAMARHADLLRHAEAGELFPILHDAERVIADPIVRNRGTVGGSLCQADPSEDLSAVFAALRASLVVHGSDGPRTVPARDFFVGPYQTVLAGGELLGEIRVPIRARDTSGSSAYVKVDRRAGDWAVAAAGAVVSVENGMVADVGIGLTALGAERFVAAEAEDFLRGGPPTEAGFVEAGRIAAEHCRPAADQRGPVDYKRHLAGELVTRALRHAVGRAAGRVR